MASVNEMDSEENWAALIEELRPKLFELDREVLEEEVVSVRITDIGKDNTTSKIFEDGTALSNFIATSLDEEVRVRVISIRSERTIGPLGLTAELLLHICATYKVHPDFLQVVLSFGDEPHVTEAGSTNFSLHLNGTEEARIAYELRYVELNKRVRSQDPWSLRHTGIYHHHKSDLDLFIVLHPVQNSLFETCITNLEGNGPACAKICTDPFKLHSMLFNSYLDNWRWYFRYLGDIFSEDNNKAMIVDPEKNDASTAFRRVQSLRNIIDIVIFARACCTADLEVLHRLQNFGQASLKQNTDVQSRETNLRDYISGADGLQNRLRNAIDLVGYTLTLHNQLETAKVDKEVRTMTQNLCLLTEEMKILTEDMKNLTQDTVDDSTTVKIITFVSAIYLPGSFVGSIFGMNFFVFNQQTRGIEISNDFWIFIATWLPLTLITGTLYMLVVYLDKRRKGQQFFWPWMKRKKVSSRSSSSR